MRFAVGVGQLELGAGTLEARKVVFQAKQIALADADNVVAGIGLGKAQVSHRDRCVVQIHIGAIDEGRAVTIFRLVGDAEMARVVQHDVLCLDDAHRSLS
ncbi:hypothetical protein D3C72_1642290 [compost metagenome]